MGLPRPTWRRPDFERSRAAFDRLRDVSVQRPRLSSPQWLRSGSLARLNLATPSWWPENTPWSRNGGLPLPYKIIVVAIMGLVSCGTLVTFGTAGAETNETSAGSAALPGFDEATPRSEGQIMATSPGLFSADDLLSTMNLYDFTPVGVNDFSSNCSSDSDSSDSDSSDSDSSDSSDSDSSDSDSSDSDSSDSDSSDSDSSDSDCDSFTSTSTTSTPTPTPTASATATPTPTPTATRAPGPVITPRPTKTPSDKPTCSIVGTVLDSCAKN